MSEERTSVGSVVLGWWGQNIGNREIAGNRALAARLRRADPVGVLAERAVIELAGQIGIAAGSGERLDRFIRMVRLLAEVRSHDSRTLAARVGGADQMLSELRFQRLLRAEEDEAEDLIRRAILVADRKCNVAALGSDLLYWTAPVRQRWCFHYFGADAPTQPSRESQT